MKATVLTVAVLASAVLLSACGSSKKASTTTSSGGSSGGSTLVGTVGPGFTISLDHGGSKVSSLTAGSYTINVDDKSDIHNFHLTGPGVDKSTEVGTSGSTTWTVDLKAGTYHYQCDPHASQMNGSFTVT